MNPMLHSLLSWCDLPIASWDIRHLQVLPNYVARPVVLGRTVHEKTRRLRSSRDVVFLLLHLRLSLRNTTQLDENRSHYRWTRSWGRATVESSDHRHWTEKVGQIITPQCVSFDSRYAPRLDVALRTFVSSATAGPFSGFGSLPDKHSHSPRLQINVVEGLM